MPIRTIRVVKCAIASCSVIVMGAIALGGCSPYRETYRPLISGRVVDENGAPVPAASVEARSEASWGSLQGCPRRGTAKAASDGKFEFESIREIDMCCFGEAPLPRTIVSVCMPSIEQRTRSTQAHLRRDDGYFRIFGETPS